MAKKAILVLEDGSVYEGYTFGAEVDACGEVVFNTSMAGYQEMLTDPSYAGQIVMPTYPLIGNYGTNGHDFESDRIQVRGFVVREECLNPSHFLNNGTIHEYLLSGGIPGIYGLDTRAITRKLRLSGVMMGIITSSMTPTQALEKLKSLPRYGTVDFVAQVTTRQPYSWGAPCDFCDLRTKCASQGDKCLFGYDVAREGVPPAYNVVVVDCGLKYTILRMMCNQGCRVIVVPSTTSAEDVMSLEPDGIVLSPGPGDPERLDYIVATVKQLVNEKPVMGICLGNQLIARAFGAKTFKLKFGHRGANHPVRDLRTGRIHITAQNHGYATDPDTLKNGLEVTHVNLNDGTVEGLRHRELPVFSIQYHSEASPGPLDNVYLFQQFLKMMEDCK